MLPAGAAGGRVAAPVTATAPLVTRTDYRNPVSRPFADTFADPSVIRGKDGWWYAYGTTDPLREGETTPHRIPIARSHDLVSWTYVGDAFTAATLPSWAAADAALWAPDIRFVNGRYYLYYVVTQTTVTPERNDNAIGVATAPTPTGPWQDSGGPVVGPRHGPGGADDFKWTFDPAEFTDVDGTKYLYYGSYYGGIWVTRLSDDGEHAVGDPKMVAIDNRYEGAYVIRHDGWYYLFASEANCCAGPVTGYSVFVGRSKSVLGPFVDREGQPLDVSRVGGTIVVTPNGNTWVGTGHNAVFTDLAHHDWLLYHAIDRNHPYLDEPFGINRRPMLMDRLCWLGGWPLVRGGLWASDTPQPAPVASKKGARSAHSARDCNPRSAGLPPQGKLDPAYSDDFNGAALGPAWSWIRSPDGHEAGGEYVWPTQSGDLSADNNTASVLLRAAPTGAYTVEAKFSIDLGTDTVRNYQQAGLIAYQNDDSYNRLTQTAIWNTRQTEFGKDMVYAGRAIYGSMAVGPTAETMWIRLYHTFDGARNEHHFRAATSRDGHKWIRGGVWTLPGGSQPRIGLISMGGSGATARFDYFRVYRR
jgi:arabinan endo-1,5-alpha-L-arabinosidase